MIERIESIRVYVSMNVSKEWGHMKNRVAYA